MEANEKARERETKRVRERSLEMHLMIWCAGVAFHFLFHFIVQKVFCLFVVFCFIAQDTPTLTLTLTHAYSPSNNIFSHSMYISVLIIHYLFLLVVRSFAVYILIYFLLSANRSAFALLILYLIIFPSPTFFLVLVLRHSFYSIVSKHVIKT